VVGATLLLFLSRPLAILTFGSDHHSAAVALLSLAVAFRVISAGQGALIQGLRRIPDLAKLGILGALLGTVISIPAVYVGGADESHPLSSRFPRWLSSPPGRTAERCVSIRQE
jgi:O-antigen/teichoic acid export membrane protein